MSGYNVHPISAGLYFPCDFRHLQRKTFLRLLNLVNADKKFSFESDIETEYVKKISYNLPRVVKPHSVSFSVLRKRCKH